VQGWRFQLSLFGNVIANEVYADAAKAVDVWYAAWWWRTIKRGRRRSPGLSLWNQLPRRFSLLDGLDDLSAHIGAAQRLCRASACSGKAMSGTVRARYSRLDCGGQRRERADERNERLRVQSGWTIDSVTGFDQPASSLIDLARHS